MKPKRMNISGDYYIQDNKVVGYSKTSDCSTFVFNVDAYKKLNAPTDIAIDNKYVGGEIKWNAIDSYNFELNIRNENGDIVYKGVTDEKLKLVNDFKYYLKSNGTYTIEIKAIDFPNLGRTITKALDSDMTSFDFHYDSNTGKISAIPKN